MDAECLWALFWATGLPEAAALAEYLLRAERTAEQAGRTA